MAVRTDRLWSDAQPVQPGVWVNLVTVPDGERWILKELVLRHTSSSPQQTALRLGPGEHFIDEALPGPGTTVRSRWLVLRAGDQVAINTTGPTAVRTTASGTRLVL